MTKKEFYTIPYWDRLRIAKLSPEPDYDTGVEHLHARQLDKTHYLLSQLVVVYSRYVRYEYLLVTIHGLQSNGYYSYKTYKPLIQVWFD